MYKEENLESVEEKVTSQGLEFKDAGEGYDLEDIISRKWSRCRVIERKGKFRFMVISGRQYLVIPLYETVN